MTNTSQAKPKIDTLEPVRLKYLKINRYRNVRPGTELRFDDEWNLLLGKNGTGKTTFLRMLEAVLSGRLERLDRTPLDVEHEMECGTIKTSAHLEWYCGVWNPPMDGPEVMRDGWIQPGGPKPAASLIPFDFRI